MMIITCRHSNRQCSVSREAQRCSHYLINDQNRKEKNDKESITKMIGAERRRKMGDTDRDRTRRPWDWSGGEGRSERT